MSATAILAPEAGPSTLKQRPWGGSRLARLRGGGSQAPIGESWEFSTLAGSESRSDGMPLSERLGHSLPFLAKLIDTELPLSVQVHPGDGTRDGDGRPIAGKEEAWIVLDAEPNAELFVGLRPGTTAEQLATATRMAVADPTREGELLDLLDRVPARVGTVILVPTGTVHAIGPGILLAEIQQPSDCTYRLYDYGSNREIHTDLALQTAKSEQRPLLWMPGSPHSSLSGAHVELQIREAGTHVEPRAEYERLLVVARGGAQLSSPDGTEILQAGDLRLACGPEFVMTIEPDGIVVVGSVRP